MPARSENPASRPVRSTSGKSGISTPAVSQWANQAGNSKPFVAKSFGSSSDAWALGIYLPLGRLYRPARTAPMGPAASAVAVDPWGMEDRSGGLRCVSFPDPQTKTTTDRDRQE